MINDFYAPIAGIDRSRLLLLDKGMGDRLWAVRRTLANGDVYVTSYRKERDARRDLDRVLMVNDVTVKSAELLVTDLHWQTVEVP